MTPKRQLRADEFVAESLEKIADEMPPGHTSEIEILRKHAANLRRSNSTHIVTVTEQSITAE